MALHALLYFVIALAYADAAAQSFKDGNKHGGFREIVLASLYVLLAIVLLDAILGPEFVFHLTV
jgi:hypothetical protein